LRGLCEAGVGTSDDLATVGIETVVAAAEIPRTASGSGSQRSLTAFRFL
jgi:hypothetical protein